MSDTSYNLYDKIASIDWNGQNFVLTARGEITGNTFTYAYSSDGLSWTKSSVYPTTNPYSVKSLGDECIIGGDSSGTLINLVDGEFPTYFSTNLNSNSVFYDIERNIEQPHRIVFPKTVALAMGNTIAYSIDQGQSWTNVASSPFSVSARGAVWSGKLWIAVGSGSENTIATSLDGINWIGRGNYIFSSSGNGVDWSPSQKKYVAIGSGINQIATSMDGVYWRGTNVAIFAEGYDIKWGGGIWVAVGSSKSSGNTIAYSTDAVTWQYTENSFQTAGLSVYYESAIWTIYGQDPSYNIAKSADGIHWTLSYSTELILGQPAGLFSDPSLNLYPGVPYPLKTCSSVTAINRYVCNKSDRGCAFIQPISIACGSGSCSLAYSIDGIFWNAINTSLFTHCNRAVWNGVLWVAVGSGQYWVATSPDGLCWTGRNDSLMTECRDVAWNGAYFVAIGSGSSLMATSADGITWTAVTSIGAIFTANIRAIEWTGNVWLAYGSGSNTTAISSSQDATSWTPTSSPNICAVDCSNILVANTSASSYQGSPANVFDGSFNTRWSSAASNYDMSGNYIGSSVTQGISGEWLQVQLTSPSSCANYYIAFMIADASSIPKAWTILGSSDGSSWNTIDTFNYGTSTPPNNDWKTPFVCLPLAIDPGLVASYSYYRVVFTANFGAGYVSVSELALFDAGSKQLDSHIRPIVLKDLVLHPVRNLSTIPNIYRITDLSCNIIRSGVVHGGQYVNNAIYGLTGVPCATAFDGANHVVVSTSGEVSYLSNTASNTNLNFDNTVSGVTGTTYAACYNRKFILIGSYYGTMDTAQFYPNNLSSLFAVINGLASNSGYGHVVSPNTLYLKEDERLSVVTPKYYDSSVSADTSISFNVFR